MIKLSLQSLSYRDTFNDGQIDLMGIIESAYELQMDGVDLHFTHFASTDDDYLEEVKQACLRRGLHMCYIGVSNNFGKTGDALRADIEQTKEWTDIAQRMGVPLVRIFAAWLPDDEPEGPVWERMFGAIREVVDYAAERDVVIGLHNHNHGCVTRTGDDVLRILDTIDSPYFSHILDTGQYVGSPGASGANRDADAEEGLYNSIATSAHRAVHVRAKFYRVASGVEEWLDYPRILKILKGVDYNGWMSVVYEGWDAEPAATAVPKAVEHLRTLLVEAGM